MDHVKDLTAPRKFGWIDGHPDTAMKEDWSQYEHVWVRSHHWLSEFKTVMPRSSVILGAPTNLRYAPRNKDPEYDIAFLGAPSDERVVILQHLINLNKYKILVAGSLGNELKGDFTHEGDFIENDEMGLFYNRAWVSPYIITNQIDTEKGFVSSAPFDIAAMSDCMVIHEQNKGLRDIFKVMPVFFDLKDLEDKIDYYIKYNDVAKRIAATSRSEANDYTFDRAAKQMEDFIT
jgi:spore maturation protein CgeB